MKFKRCGFKNFLRYGNTLTEYDLDQHGITLICGKNGMGKSVLVDAIYFALYGKPYRKVRNGSLINEINGKNLFVYLELESGDDIYRIERTQKPNTFTIFKNGEELPTYKKLDQQDDFTENVFRMPEKVFRQVVVLGSTYHTPFLRLQLSQKREIIESLFNLELFDEMKKTAKAMRNKVEVQLSEIKSDIKTLNAEIVLLDENITKIEKYNDSVTLQHDQKKKMLENSLDEKIKLSEIMSGDEDLEKTLSDTLEKIDTKIEELTEKIRLIQKEIIASSEEKRFILANEIERAREGETSLSSLKNEKSDIEKKINEYTNCKGRPIGNKHNQVINIGYKPDIDYNKLMDRINILMHEYHTIEKKLAYYQTNDTCSECGSDLRGEHFKSMVKSLQIDLDKIDKETSKNSITLKDHSDKINLFLDGLIAKNQELLKNKVKEIDLLEKNINVIKENIKIIKTDIENDGQEKKGLIEVTDGKISALKDKKREYQNKLVKESSRKKTYDNLLIEIESIKKQIESIGEVQLQSIQDFTDKIRIKRTELVEKQELEAKKVKLIDIFKHLIDDVLADNGAKAYIINRYLPLLNKTAKDILVKFDADFSLNFTDTLNVEIYRRGHEKEYDSFSGGQRQRIDLTVLFTFVQFISNRTNISTNFMLFDEVLDVSLDEEGIDEVFSIIDMISETGKSIFLISHKDTNNERSDRVYQVVNNKGFAEVKKMR